jgi:fumarylacetoacetase
MALKSLTSWVQSANGHPDFPLENLPFGRFRYQGDVYTGFAIGDFILIDADRGVARELLDENARDREHTAQRLVPQSAVEMLLPFDIGDYTDFYASMHHATNVGSMFRPDNPLLPNYKYVPIGYHGRASSIVVSGTPFHRPNGQTRDDPNQPPSFGPSRRLDYEMELGIVIGEGNPLGDPIPIDRADDHILGLCILNDWSARDIQTWEYQPLGPFLAKSFATSISPWVVTLDALAPFRIEPAEHDPPPLPYLAPPGAAYDITLEVWLRSAKMSEPMRISRGNFRDMYWTIAQLVAHHTSNGCNLRPGDLLGSGTVSGTTKESRGCLLERTWRGTEPIELPTGEQRRFLEDGDEVIMRAYCEREGATRIGFGECRGTVMEAKR